jgi:hypothetical protein
MGMCVLFKLYATYSLVNIALLYIVSYLTTMHSLYNNMQGHFLTQVVLLVLLTLKKGFLIFGCGICEVEMMYFHLDQS